MKIKKLLILILSIITIIVCVCFAGCDDKLKTDNEYINDKYAFVSGLRDNRFVYDKETKQCYLMIIKNYGTDEETIYGFIPLYDENGKPLLYEGD